MLQNPGLFHKEVKTGKHLVLIGGGHAHMLTLARLNTFVREGHRVSVIGPSEYHYYSGMGPGMLSQIYRPDEIRFHTRHAVEHQGGTFLRDTVVRIDPNEKTLFLGSGRTLSYDVLSVNAGSHVPNTLISNDQGDIFPVKPIERLIDAQSRLLDLMSKRHITIGIVGGGASAVEIAGNLWRLADRFGRFTPRIQVFAGKRFMARYPEKVGRMARTSLLGRKINLIESEYVTRVSTGCITLTSGSTSDVDIVFLSSGVTPSPVFESSGIPTGPDGGMMVNAFLQSPVYPEIFGGGDCIYFQPQPLDKVGVYAVRANPVIFHNLMATLTSDALKTFDPGGDYLLIFNLGDGTGIFVKGHIIFQGRSAFAIKNFIDRRFMKKFKSFFVS